MRVICKMAPLSSLLVVEPSPISRKPYEIPRNVLFVFQNYVQEMFKLRSAVDYLHLA